jgi:hypothetical protein
MDDTAVTGGVMAAITASRSAAMVTFVLVRARESKPPLDHDHNAVK